MNIFIFKTDIHSRIQVEQIRPILNQEKTIIKWSIDTDDCDKVLKIEAIGDRDESDMIDLVQTQGFYCEALPD